LKFANGEINAVGEVYESKAAAKNGVDRRRRTRLKQRLSI
jgi:uncharacterized protein YegP (UPF0339 family)